MPELPEVETTCRGISPHITNKKIADIVIRNHQLRWPIPKNFIKLTKGQTVKNVARRAKYLLVSLNNNSTILIHLGMSGKLVITNINTPPEKHSHVDIIFNKNTILRYTDPRRFGSLLLAEGNPEDHKLLANLGPEPLQEGFTGKYLLNRAMNKKQAVKQFIMDASIVVGVGNIYAAEALFKSNINPLTPAKNITLAQYNKLVIAIKKILAISIEKGGTTLKDFLGSDGKPGYFVQSLMVYGRGGEDCIKCKATLQEIKLGQRTTVFCTKCQPTVAII